MVFRVRMLAFVRSVVTLPTMTDDFLMKKLKVFLQTIGEIYNLRKMIRSKVSFSRLFVWTYFPNFLFKMDFGI